MVDIMNNEVNSNNIFIALQQQFEQSNRTVKVFEPIADKIVRIKEKWSISEDTLLGTILYRSGGIVFDGWVRLLASGERDIVSWNEALGLNNYIIVADDVLGGLFGLDTNEKLAYFAPDTLEWEGMNITYPQFVRWLVEGDVDKFYENFRWDNWKSEVLELGFSDGINFYPFLWAKAEQERSRKAISLKEIVSFALEMQNQLEHTFVICDECGSEYYRSASKMASLCPECSSILYDYENCVHEFENGWCVKCFWDGRASSYLKN